jgi:L-asparaginase II
VNVASFPSITLPGETDTVIVGVTEGVIVGVGVAVGVAVGVGVGEGVGVAVGVTVGDGVELLKESVLAWVIRFAR